MTQIHQCSDQSDAVNLYPVLGLFLKPIARINVTVHFPTLKQSLPTGGKSVSSWEVMEKIKALVAPENFISLKVVKNTLEFIRFEGDLENRSVLKTIIARLEGRSLKLTGFKELLKIRAAETKIPFPSKYDWDSFFRDAKHMNEMKPGERPDTIHFQCLPSKWFSEKKTVDKPVPSEKLFRRVWETFGEVRCVDIPVLDPYRQQMQPNIAGIKTFTFSQDPVFEAYVQYKDYLSFVKAMDALRGCFLMYQEANKSWVASIKVTFDKTKHLSEESIRKRKVERERLMEEERIRERAKLKAKADSEAATKEATESKEKSPDKEDLTKEGKKSVEYKIALEERMYMVARRKLESVRLLDYLFDRIKEQHEKQSKKGPSVGNISERSNASMAKSDRLSPSFYTAERSPRIDKCRSPHSKRDSRRSSTPRSNHRKLSRERSSRSRSFDRRRSLSRGRSNSRHRAEHRRRTVSRSRSRSRARSASYHRGRDHSPGRYESRPRSSERRRSRSRSPPPGRSDRSPPRERSYYEGHSSSHYSRSDRSPGEDFRGPRDKRPFPRSYYEGKIPRDSNSHFSYMHDWELKPRKAYFNPALRGRGGFRGRGPGRVLTRGASGRNFVAYNYDYTNDTAYLQEAYNDAYTRYFKSISRTSDSKSTHEGDIRHSDSRSPSRSPSRH